MPIRKEKKHQWPKYSSQQVIKIKNKWNAKQIEGNKS